MNYYPGQAVKGSVTGRYLGTIKKCYQNSVVIKGPDGSIIQLGKMLVRSV